MNGIHSCNYFCERPACIKAQRDEMRDALFDQHTVAALRQKLAAQSEPVGWAYIHAGECEEMGWGLPPDSVGKEATLLYAAPQRTYEGEPVAWCQQSNRDGSYGVPVVFAGYAMYEENLAKAKQDPWIVNGAAKLVPLYAAPPRTFDDGLEAELALAKSIALDAESEARIANERNHAMSQACDEAHDQFQRAEAENAALRDPVHMDAERYRWFRLQGLWDSEHFPWPDNFEYPEGISEDDGAMLDAAIDAVRKA